MRRLGTAAAAALLVGSTLVSCASGSIPGWSPASWPEQGRMLDALPAVEPSEAATVGMRIRNDQVGIDARWAYLPGEQPVNDAIEQVVRAAVAERSAVAGTGYRPQVFAPGSGLRERGCAPGATQLPGPEILGERAGAVLVCEVAIARGPVFAQTLRVVTGASGSVDSDTLTTIYADLASGAAGTAETLFSDPDAVWTAMVAVLRRAAGSLSLTPVAAPDALQREIFAAALAGTVLSDGEFVVPVPAGLHAPELEGLGAWHERARDRPLFVALDASALAAALSPLGHAVVSASGPYTGPAWRGAGFDRAPCDLAPCMAMTLDDGPDPLTPHFIDVLREEQSAATFYMLGQRAAAYPDIVRRIADEGHEIGNHTWNHPSLTRLSAGAIESQLSRTRELLHDLSGQPIATFRPPGGSVNSRVLAVAGMPAILWSVDTRDWEKPADDALTAYAVNAPEPGTIILMHDIQPVSWRVFGPVVEGLRDRGFLLVTVQQLFDGQVPSGIVRRGPQG